MLAGRKPQRKASRACSRGSACRWRPGGHRRHPAGGRPEGDWCVHAGRPRPGDAGGQPRRPGADNGLKMTENVVQLNSDLRDALMRVRRLHQAKERLARFVPEAVRQMVDKSPAAPSRSRSHATSSATSSGPLRGSPSPTRPCTSTSANADPPCQTRIASICPRTVRLGAPRVTPGGPPAPSTQPAKRGAYLASLDVWPGIPRVRLWRHRIGDCGCILERFSSFKTGAFHEQFLHFR